MPSSGRATYQSQDITSIGITAFYKIAFGKVNSKDKTCAVVFWKTQLSAH